MASTKNFNWNAPLFFEWLTKFNKLARSEKAVFCRVSGIDGFEEALSRLQSANMIVAVSDTSSGALVADGNTPHLDRVKLVLLAKRHKVDDMIAREHAMDTLRELFRQFMSQLVQEKIRLEEHCIYLDDSISFNEIDKYFASGMACAYFQMKVTTYTDLSFNEAEWCMPIQGFTDQFTNQFT